MNKDMNDLLDKKVSISSVQYFVFLSSAAVNHTSVLSTFDSGGIGRNPSPKKNAFK